MHYHDFHELVIVREGTGRHLYPGGSCPLGKGNFFVVRPGSPHGYADCRNFELVNVLFFPELLLFSWEKAEADPGISRLLDSVPSPDGSSAPGAPPCLNAGAFDTIRPLLLAMKRERLEKKSDFELAMNANFLQLLLNLSRAVLGSKPARPAGEPRLNRLIGFLKTNYPDPAAADLRDRGGEQSDAQDHGTAVQEIHRRFSGRLPLRAAAGTRRGAAEKPGVLHHGNRIPLRFLQPRLLLPGVPAEIRTFPARIPAQFQRAPSGRPPCLNRETGAPRQPSQQKLPYLHKNGRCPYLSRT